MFMSSQFHHRRRCGVLVNRRWKGAVKQAMSGLYGVVLEVADFSVVCAHLPCAGGDQCFQIACDELGAMVRLVDPFARSRCLL
eukprot:2766427-Karenia_brevis.AAC.1